MDLGALRRLEEVMASPEMLAQTVEYLTDNMSAFLRPGDKIMICFPGEGRGSLAWLLSQAAKNLEAIPVTVGSDHRWMSLLRCAFHSRATVIAAPPFVVLGLTKLSRNTKTPLFFRHVMTAGYRCSDWMMEGIQRGLDCHTWGCFGPGTGPVVSGFSCEEGRGVHLRTDLFRFEIVDEEGVPVPEGELGEIVLQSEFTPSVRYPFLERGRLTRGICTCGKDPLILTDLCSGPDVDPMLEQLGRDLLSWTSVLDCRFKKGEAGLEAEIIVFPGEKLPKLPAMAKLDVRGWDPDTDVPYWFQPEWRKMSDDG